MSRLLIVTLVLSVLSSTAMAEKVEVAPGIKVTKKTYPVPLIEQPFLGFAQLTPLMIKANEDLVASAIKQMGSREAAFSSAIHAGWRAIEERDFVSAGHRFNQAFLLRADQSDVFFGFSVLVRIRFNDYDYADELSRVALRQPGQSKHLRAEYGKVLLWYPRWKEALPVLEQAVLDAPEVAQTWINLSITRLRNGDPKGACAALAEAEKRDTPVNVRSNALIEIVLKEAQC